LILINSDIFDIAIIGGGIVGMATAMTLSRNAGLSIIVLEAEDHLAAHQTGHNSGVIHSGLYYKPGSLKARNCIEGREAMYRFCEEHAIAHERCGKIVVATHPRELPALELLEERGRANGLEGIRRLTPAEIKEYEPHATGLAGLHVPQTGIVDYIQVTETYARILRDNNGVIRTNTRMTGWRNDAVGQVIETTNGLIHARKLINCAGLQSDRIARLCGFNPKVQIMPFRGEYYELAPEKQHLVKNLLYPVPDTRFPFLGVHFTRMVHGGVEAGPNAVPALKREGYSWGEISLRDTMQFGASIGFWRMGLKFWKMGLGEIYRSFSKRAFVKALQRLVPELAFEDIHRSGAGVRAQALEPDGQLVDDFRIMESSGMIHVLNAPSPAATASLSIGKTIAAMALRQLDLPAGGTVSNDEKHKYSIPLDPTKRNSRI
jgi:L-2-hydroxyglutarate oxidase